MPMIGARFYAQIDNSHVRGDLLENDLAKVNRRKRWKKWKYFLFNGQFFRNLIAVDYSD